jgi:hypothetical protein
MLTPKVSTFINAKARILDLPCKKFKSNKKHNAFIHEPDLKAIQAIQARQAIKN